MPDRSWNRQLAAGDTQPIPHSLATVVARFLANNAAGRRASGPDDSICFISPNERRVAGPTVFCVAAILRTECRFWVISGTFCEVQTMSALPPIADIGADGLLVRSMPEGNIAASPTMRARGPMSIARAHSAQANQTTTAEGLSVS